MFYLWTAACILHAVYFPSSWRICDPQNLQPCVEDPQNSTFPLTTSSSQPSKTTPPRSTWNARRKRSWPPPPAPPVALLLHKTCLRNTVSLGEEFGESRARVWWEGEMWQCCWSHLSNPVCAGHKQFDIIFWCTQNRRARQSLVHTYYHNRPVPMALALENYIFNGSRALKASKNAFYEAKYYISW